MEISSIIPWLAGVTLLIALAFGIYQRVRVHQAKRDHEPAVPGETTSGGIVRDLDSNGRPMR